MLALGISRAAFSIGLRIISSRCLGFKPGNQELRRADCFRQIGKLCAVADEVRTHGDKHEYVRRLLSRGFQQQLYEMRSALAPNRLGRSVLKRCAAAGSITEELLELIDDQKDRIVAELGYRMPNVGKAERRVLKHLKDLWAYAFFRELTERLCERTRRIGPRMHRRDSPPASATLAASASSNGRSPARTSDDFPLPELPMTAMNRLNSTSR